MEGCGRADLVRNRPPRRGLWLFCAEQGPDSRCSWLSKGRDGIWLSILHWWLRSCMSPHDQIRFVLGLGWLRAFGRLTWKCLGTELPCQERGNLQQDRIPWKITTKQSSHEPTPMNPVSCPIVYSSSRILETSNQLWIVAFIYSLPLLEFLFLVKVSFVPAVALLNLGHPLTQCKGSVIIDGMNGE